MNRLNVLFVAAVFIYSGAAAAQSSKVDYGVVTKVSPAELGGGNDGKIATAAGALLGGVTGYTLSKGSSSGKKRRGTIAGTALGGLGLNKLAKSATKGYQYDVKLANGKDVSITTEQGRIDQGDCVAIEQGESANIRRVSQVHCESKDAKATEEHVTEANECEAAKAAILQAKDQQEQDKAIRTARVKCEE